MGNVHGRVEGANVNAEALLIGSHMDTVVDAGMFDRSLGIVSAISALKVMNIIGKLQKLKRPVEVHIEQGPVLEQFGFPLGVVKGISGQTRLKGVGLLYTMCGTSNYVIPEVLNNKGYDGAATDVWLCGAILYVLMAGYLPFKEAGFRTRPHL